MAQENTKDINAAIVAAIGQVRKLAKIDTNKFDGYKFASIDAFLSLVNPICAEVGLFIRADEVDIHEFTKKSQRGESSWVRVTYDVTACHVSGQSLPPSRRSVEVARNGAQAFGSAQSYVLKQFMRSLFLIPTGDKDDADFKATEDGVVQGKPKAQSRDLFASMMDAARACKSIEARNKWSATAKNDFMDLHKDFKQLFATERLEMDLEDARKMIDPCESVGEVTAEVKAIKELIGKRMSPEIETEIAKAEADRVMAIEGVNQ